jgi:hypothetical protein
MGLCVFAAGLNKEGRKSLFLIQLVDWVTLDKTYRPEPVNRISALGLWLSL